MSRWSLLNSNIGIVRVVCEQKLHYTHGYRFTKWRMQNLNLRTHVKLEYNINSLNYPTEIQLSSLVPILLNYVFFYVWHDQWFKRY